MADVRRSGLKPLRVSTNTIHSKSFIEGNKKQNVVNDDISEIKKTLNCAAKELLKSKICGSKKIVKKQSLEKKKIKKAIKTILNKEQRLKKWLTTKEKIDDVEYWKLTSERLCNELNEESNHLDELELENELLISEFEQLKKLVEKAMKLNKIISQINLDQLKVAKISFCK